MELIETTDTNNYGALETNHDNDVHKTDGLQTNKLGEKCNFTSYCPITHPGSIPICGIVKTGNGVTILCAAESPSFWGGSFDFDQRMPNTIYDIVTNTNRKDHCSVPTGVGSNVFHVHCACGGGCLIDGMWTVFWNPTK